MNLIQDRINYLRENTDFGSALFKSLIGYAIIAADFDGNIIAYNEGARQIYGYAPEEIIGKENIEVFFPKGFIEAGKLRQLISELISKERVSYEGEKVRKDGSRFPAQVLLALTKDKNSKVVGFIEIVKDLTESKRAEEMLQSSEANLRKVIEKNADSIIIVDGNEVLCFVNPAAEALFGRKGEELIGELFGFPVTAGGTTEIEIIRRGGEAIVAEMRVVEMDWVGKRAYLASLRDVTERKKAEEERKKMILQLQDALQLEAANKELEAFSYSVSHDLRAPLRAIDGFSRVILEDYTDKFDEEGKRILNVIRSNTQKMGQLIDDLLVFSRLGRQEIRISDIDMETLANTVYEEVKITVPHRDVQFNIRTLSPAQGDKAMIRQVLVNLLSNAVKFTRPKDIAVIEVGGSNKENEHIYYMKDNGVGFDMQYANKLFGVFQRLHSTEEFEGTGVGLAIVQRIIHRHGGRVWAEGKVGEGAIFYFTLPRREG